MRIHRDLAGWGVFFVVAGGVPLAVQTGILDPAVLDRWWTFWPLILVGIGLGLIFTKTSLEMLGGLIVSGTLGLLAAGILTGGFGGIGDLPSGVCGPGGGGTPFPARTGSFETDAVVEVEVACGTVELATTDGQSWVVEGVDDTGQGPDITADFASLDIKPPDEDFGRFLGERDRWVVSLPTEQRLDVLLSVDAGSVVADLGSARLGVFDVELNAGQATVNLRDVAEIDEIDVGHQRRIARALPAGRVDDRHHRGECRQHPAVRPAWRGPAPAYRGQRVVVVRLRICGARPGGRHVGDPGIRHGGHEDRAADRGERRVLPARPRGGLLVSGRGPIAAGLVLIVIGGLFLAREAIPGFDFGRLWPIASVVLGVTLLVLSIRPGRPTG